MGEVYRARDTALGRDVAIKVLPATLVQDPDRLRRFKQEAQAIHRDLKPESIFLTRDGRAEILDFGLAKLIHPNNPPVAT